MGGLSLNQLSQTSHQSESINPGIFTFRAYPVSECRDGKLEPGGAQPASNQGAELGPAPGFPSYSRTTHPMLTKGTCPQHVTLDPVPRGRQDYLVLCQGWGRVTTQ